MPDPARPSPEPTEKPWAAPGLTEEERAGRLLWRGIYPEVRGAGSAAQEAHIREALAVVRRDALEEAAREAEAMFFDAVAARIRALPQRS